jgi:glutamate dehydrogenase
MGKRSSDESLRSAASRESNDFKQHYLWLEDHMPQSLFEELGEEGLFLLTHNLMTLHLQDYFSQIHLKDRAIVLIPDMPGADVKILKHYELHGIRYYRTFVSNAPLTHDHEKRNLRVAIILFSEIAEPDKEAISEDKKDEIISLVGNRNTKIENEEFEDLFRGMTSRFLRSMTPDRLVTALDLYFRAKSRDHCQFETRFHEDWKEKDSPSMQVVLAWKNVPKYKFLFRLAEMIQRHNLNMQRVVAAYINPHSTKSVLILSLALHGKKGGAAWDEADIPDFIRELTCLKFSQFDDVIDKVFVSSALVKGTLGHFIRNMQGYVHQMMVHMDPNLYSFSNIEEGFCRHPELTAQLCDLFELKFHPDQNDQEKYQTLKHGFLRLVDNIDTGHPLNDKRRKNILKQGLYFIDYTLKTNFYREYKAAFSFRIDPKIITHLPYVYEDKFPQIPFAIFYIKGLSFIGFHIRFKDLSRGGLRTIVTQRKEQYILEKNNVFSECYNLAFTQHKKNKDIPEGGSKGVILLAPYDDNEHESEIYAKELKILNTPESIAKERVKEFEKEQKLELMYHAQRSFVHSFLVLLNCDEQGNLKAGQIIDYWKKPEYIYLGPDENMHNPIIEWISQFSQRQGYKPGLSFISSKPNLGINHKEYGVTSLGVTVYMHQVLINLGIDPENDPFTIKISGGPDGDVAGNMIVNLQNHYKNTAKIIALTDVSGTIYDPEGLDLNAMVTLFREGKPIRFYPPDTLHDGGFLLDVKTKREQTAYITQTLCYKKKDGKIEQEWLSGNEMNALYRSNVHQAKADIFIPAGGRPRTLNETNYRDYLDESGRPTSMGIVEGANLYLTEKARHALQKLGVLIIKDSSANKGGVICSSFEVLSTLTLDKETFLQEKDILVEEILDIIRKSALLEAKLLLSSFQKTQIYLTDLSDEISKTINKYKYQILHYLDDIVLSNNTKDKLIQTFLKHAPKTLREKYSQELLDKIPDSHKKAIIACFIASHVVYTRGLVWSPTIVDILPLLTQDPDIMTDN